VLGAMDKDGSPGQAPGSRHLCHQPFFGALFEEKKHGAGTSTCRGTWYNMFVPVISTMCCAGRAYAVHSHHLLVCLNCRFCAQEELLRSRLSAPIGVPLSVISTTVTMVMSPGALALCF
jgi:hypothetical protein